MLATTPSGSQPMRSSVAPAPVPPARPRPRSTRPALARKKSTRPARALSSLSACCSGLPISSVSVRARRSLFSATRAFQVATARWRVSKGVAHHPGCAARAAARFLGDGRGGVFGNVGDDFGRGGVDNLHGVLPEGEGDAESTAERKASSSGRGLSNPAPSAEAPRIVDELGVPLRRRTRSVRAVVEPHRLDDAVGDRARLDDEPACRGG